MSLKIKKVTSERFTRQVSVICTFALAFAAIPAVDLTAQDGGNNPPDCPDENGDYPYTDACGNPTCDEPDPDDECCDDGVTVVGPDEACCGDVSGSRTFGSITATFDASVAGTEIDGSDYCAYSSSADLSFTTASPYGVSVSVTGASVDWEENDSGDVQNVSISWSGSEDVGEIGYITSQVTNIDATDSSGTVTFSVNLSGATALMGGIEMKDTASGDITYDLSGSNYDFSGVAGVELQIKAGDDDDIIAVTTASALEESGDFTVDFSAESDASFVLGDLTMAVNSAAINVTFSNQETSDPITLNSGDVDFDVDFSDVESIDAGEVNFAATVDGTTVTMAGTASSDDPIEAFGAELSGSLEIEINLSTFDFTKITGSSINLRHADFEDDAGGANCLTGIDLVIENGAITTFNVGALEFVHSTTGVRFSITGGSYSNSNVTLESVTMQFGSSFEFAVNGFTFNGDGSDPKIEELIVAIDQEPLEFNGDAEWDEGGFSVTADGSIGGELGFSGTLSTNSDSTCNGLYIMASFSVGAGVPIPYTPLKATSAGGEFGYNYEVSVNKDSGIITADKSCGNYVLGLAIGVSDTAGLIDTNIRTAFTIGNNPRVAVEGAFSVPASGSEYASGTLSTDYKFWEDSLSAAVTTSVQVPAGDGSVLSLNSGSVGFDLFGGSKSWRILANNITGTIWEVVELDGSVNVNGHLSPFDFQGRVDATLTYSGIKAFEYPSGFDPSTCETAKESDNWVGFGITGDLNIDVSGNVSALRISNDAITGSAGVDIDSAFNASVKWPCALGICGDDCVNTYSVDVTGNLTIEKQGATTRLYGDATFSDGDESETGEIDVELSGIF